MKQYPEETYIEGSSHMRVSEDESDEDEDKDFIKKAEPVERGRVDNKFKSTQIAKENKSARHIIEAKIPGASEKEESELEQIIVERLKRHQGLGGSLSNLHFEFLTIRVEKLGSDFRGSIGMSSRLTNYRTLVFSSMFPAK